MKKHIFLLFLVFIALPIKVSAINSAGNVTINCNDATIKVGESTTCTVKGSSTETIVGFKSTVTYSSDFTLSDFNPKTGFSSFGNIDIAPTIVLNFSNDDITGNFDIVTFKVTAKSRTSNTGNINLSSILYTEEILEANSNEVVPTTTNITLNIDETTPVQTVKGLSNLTVTNGSILGRQFNAEDTENTGYTVQLNSSDTVTFGINATTKNNSDNVVCKNGHTDELLVCNNITFTTSGGNSDMLIYLVVGSDETEVTYSISVVKPAPQIEPNNSLASLTVNGTQTTKVDATSYTITLDDVSSYTINATLSDDVNYKFTDETKGFFSPKTYNGEKEFVIIVVPKDETAGLESITYHLTVKKKPSENVNPGGNNNGGNNESTNPQTGGNAATVMAIILFVSFVASIYIYNRNLKQNN